MSEQERRRRSAYKLRRKRWIFAQSVLIVLLAIITILSALTYSRLDKTYYIEYNESSSVDYKVHLLENDFYEEEWLGKDQSYVASLIDKVNATFDYKLDMDATNVDYEYSYGIIAELLIVDKETERPLYKPTTVIKPDVLVKQNSNKKLHIIESFDIDYSQFNTLANKFVDSYDLRDVSCSLVVTMNVAVKGSCEEFENDSNNNYNVSFSMPLTNRTVDVEITSTVPTSEGKVMACDKVVGREIFKIATVSFSVIDVILLVILVAFTYLTRNEDINYSIKVNKILKNYRSYIQKINNEFNTDGYQILAVNSFNEMLGIRDTIQSPILTCENEDHTRTRFVIPSNTKILYMFEIKVEDYDQIYGTENDTEAVTAFAELPTIENEESFEPKTEEVKADTARKEAFTTVKRIIKIEPKVEITRATPSEAEISDSNSMPYSDDTPEGLTIGNSLLTEYYHDLKTYITSYKGIESVKNGSLESFSKGKLNLFKLKIIDKTLCLYCALEPAVFDKAQFLREQMDEKPFANVPLLIKIKSDKGLNRAKELVKLVMDNYEIKEKSDASKESPCDTAKETTERKIIKLRPVTDRYQQLKDNKGS